MNLTIGIAPDSWGVWFANDPRQPGWQQCLDEIVDAGYEWIEIGPYGYMPTDANQLRSELLVLNLSPELAEAEFRDSLPKLERDHIDQQLNELQSKAKSGTFSRTDAERMNELTKRKASLDQRPGSSRSVV